MNRFKAAFVCPSRSWGGLEMNVFKQCRWLAEKNFPVLLYCYPDSTLHEQAATHNLLFRPLASKSKLGDLFLARNLAKSLNDEKIKTALFHLNKNFPLLMTVKLMMSKQLSLIYMQHMHLGGIKKDMYHNYLYKNLDCWITPLEKFAEQLRSRTNIAPEKIRVVPFGIELERFTQVSYSQREAREKLSLPLDKKIVGFIGRFDPQKNQHLLIEAVGRIKQDIDILLVGDYSKNEEFGYEKQVRMVIDKYNLSQRVQILQHIENIETAYKALDIFCLTTGSETFGMVTIEAMASKLPVVASDQGGTLEIIQDRVNGLLYKSEDTDDLKKKLTLLLENDPLRKAIAEQGYHDALAKYSHSVQIEKLMKIMDEL